jgi:hypothetical protein
MRQWLVFQTWDAADPGSERNGAKIIVSEARATVAQGRQRCIPAVTGCGAKRVSGDMKWRDGHAGKKEVTGKKVDG